MKAKKYRLETVLDLRRRVKDEAAKLVALRFAQLEKAEEELAQRRLNLQNCYEKQNQAQTNMAEDLSKGIQASAIIEHQNYLNDLRKLEIELQKKVEEQIQAVANAEREVEKAREKLVEAAKDVKAIEVHKENWKFAERTAENRREQKLSDEIGSILHGRKNT